MLGLGGNANGPVALNCLIGVGISVYFGVPYYLAVSRASYAN